MLLLCALIVGSGVVWADDVTATLTGSAMVTGSSTSYTDYTSTGVTDDDGNVWYGRWCYVNNNGMLNMIQLRAYTNNKDDGNCSRLNVPTFSGTIKSISLNITDGTATAYSTGTGTTTTLYLCTAYSKSSLTTILTNSSGSARKTATFNLTTLDDSYTGEGLYICASAGVRIWSVAVTYTPSSAADLADDDFKFSAGSYTANIGGSNTFPTLTNTHNLDVTYQSTNESAATIDDSGDVTLLDEGETTIKAKFDGNSSYKAKTVTYELTVVDPSLTTIWSEDLSTYSAGDVPSGGTYSYGCVGSGTKIYENASTGGESPELLVAKNGGSFTATIPLLSSSYGYSGDLTLRYKTNANPLNVKTTTEGITVDGEASEGAGVTYSTSGIHKVTFKGATISTESITIVFTATDADKNVRLDDIILRGEQEAITKVATPAISPVSGAVVSGAEVTITCETVGATIYYTTNGTTPTSGSTAYNPASKPTITSACTIKAIGIKAGLTDSEVASATYTIADPCATPTFSVAAGEVTKGTTVTISSETDDATIYYTKDGSTPTTSSSVYSSAITINAAMTIKAIAVKDGYANSEVASVLYTIKDYVELPFIWNGGTTTALTNMSGVSASGLGSDYAASNAPYRQKFDGVGDYIQIKTNTQPGKVYFDVKMLGGATTSKFKVQESADGETFTDVEEFEVSGAQNLVLYFNTSTLFDASSRYIRIIKSVHGSNVGMGPIRITSVVKGFISNAGWSSFASSSVLDLDMIDGGTAYYASEASGSIVTLSPTTATIPAGEGLMIKGTAGEEFTISVAESGTAISGNLLKGQTTTGNVAASTAGTYHYIFGYQTSDPSVCGFYNLAADTEIAAGKAYLETTSALTPTAGAPAIIRILDEENNATSIERLDGKTDAIKFMENGQIYILREGVVYDALGRIVK